MLCECEGACFEGEATTHSYSSPVIAAVWFMSAMIASQPALLTSSDGLCALILKAVT